MATTCKSAVQSRRFKWNFFKQSTKLHFFLLLVVADALYCMVGGDISKGLNALYGVGIFCFVLAPISSIIADLLFAAMEILTRNDPSNRPPHDSPQDDKSRPDRKRISKGKRKPNGNPASKGKHSSSDVQIPRTNRSPDGSSLSESGVATASASPPETKSPKNYLARFASEIRLQIFKHYYGSFRQEVYYREAYYRNIDSMNLLNALKDGLPNQRLYEEALGQYRKSHQLGLLLEGEDVGRGFIDYMKSDLFQSLKDITFGPGIIESLMRPSSVILNSWNLPRSSFDVAERKSRWYSFQTAQLFGDNSRLARGARDLENITIFMENSGKLDIQYLINFTTIPSATFPNLKKICYCFPAIFPATEWNREYLNTLMFLLSLKTSPARIINTILKFKQHPWNSVSYGCQYEVSGFSWAAKDGRKIELEFVIYPS